MLDSEKAYSEEAYLKYKNSLGVKVRDVLETSKGKITVFKGLKLLNAFAFSYAGIVGIVANLLLNRMTTTALVETLIVGGVSGYATYKLNKEIKLGEKTRKLNEKEANEEYLDKFRK